MKADIPERDLPSVGGERRVRVQRVDVGKLPLLARSHVKQHQIGVVGVRLHIGAGQCEYDRPAVRG